MPSSVIDEALERWRLGQTATEKQRDRENKDLAFLDMEHQWPDDVVALKGPHKINGVDVPGEPMLCIPTMDEPIQLVLNQETSAHLGVNIHPLSEDASDDTAEILQGLYRSIERDSKAKLARSWAFDRMVKAGRGAYLVTKASDPEGGHPFDQKILIKRLLYQGAAVFDPFAQEPDWMDGEFLFIPTDMRVASFKRRWPHAKMVQYDDGDLLDLQGDHPDWIGGDTPESRTVRVAQYWRVEITEETFVLLDDGSVAADDHIPAGRAAVTGDEARSVTHEKRTVWWSHITCLEELEPAQEWDGQYIPGIPMIGREVQPFDGERRFIGMVHNAKDGARLTNYAASQAVKMAALEPQAPWQGVEGVFEGHEKEYIESNIRARLLQYKPTDLSGNPAPPPARVQVDVSRLGPSMQLLTMGRDFVQTAMFTFDPALGKQTTAHRSGRALEALQGQTIDATSGYLGSEANAMMYEACVVLDLIPHLYDRPGRLARILDEHGTSSMVMLNKPFTVDPQTKRPTAIPYSTPEEIATADQMIADPSNPAKFYDLNKGRYGVSITIGKSSASRLQQGSEEMGQILQADPSLMPIIGPEYFRFRDFPGAQTIAKLLKKMRDHSMPWLADQQQPDATQQLEQAKQQLQVQGQQLQQAAEMIKTEKIKEDAKVEIEKLKGQLEIELQRMKSAAQITIEQMKLEADGIKHATEQRNEALALGVELREKAKDRAHDVGMASQGHTQDMENAEQGQGYALEQRQQDADLTPEPSVTE